MDAAPYEAMVAIFIAEFFTRAPSADKNDICYFSLIVRFIYCLMRLDIHAKYLVFIKTKFVLKYSRQEKKLLAGALKTKIWFNCTAQSS